MLRLLVVKTAELTEKRKPHIQIGLIWETKGMELKQVTSTPPPCASDAISS
jgi:hypothetical protein